MLPPALLQMSLFGGGTRDGVAMLGGGTVVAVAYMYPIPVAPFTQLIGWYTGTASPLIAAAGLGALYYVGAIYVHDVLKDLMDPAPIVATMATIAAAAVAAGFGAEHLRARAESKAPATIQWGFVGISQRFRAAILGSAIVAGAALAFDGPVRPFVTLIQRATMVESPMVAAAGLGALYFTGAVYLHPVLMPKM
ncbi:hypothetical protein T492DRAFT_840655 [Pavlovales sp. CCMP2436]|nr:hypothetical protein T492DRAFT_840655 [Pavlovales sp. CCMP2436]